MATSETSIANSALMKLGADRIVSLTDDTREARIMKEQYPKVRDDILRGHPWNFALVRVVIAPLTTAPDWGFSYQYELPSDCLRLLNVDVPGTEWQLEGRIIVTDAAELGIRYIRKVTETGLFDSNFSEALACKLAADCCFAITQSTTLKDGLMKEYLQRIREARSFDGQESGPARVYAKEWLNSRY